jgi:hypothetical protein
MSRGQPDDVSNVILSLYDMQSVQTFGRKVRMVTRVKGLENAAADAASAFCRALVICVSI